MSKYSQANLLNEELSYQPGRKDFLGRLLHKMVKSGNVMLTLRVPLPIYLRAEIFCEDIMDLAEGDILFTQKDLLNLLYQDFLLFAKKKPDVRSIHSMLVTLEKNAGRTMNLVSKGNGSVYEVTYENEKKNMYELTVEFKRRLGLRGEVLLADMEEEFPDHGFTVEAVLEHLYCDFINKFRKGDNQEAIQTILSMLDE